MGQAYDERGHPLGSGVFGDTTREVFDKLVNLHPDAHEYRIRSFELPTPAIVEPETARPGAAQSSASQPPAGVVPSQSGDSGQIDVPLPFDETAF